MAHTPQQLAAIREAEQRYLERGAPKRDDSHGMRCALCDAPSSSYTCARCNAALERSGGKL